MERLVKIQGVSQDDVDREKAAVDSAAARLKQAEESLRLAVLGPRYEDIAAARASSPSRTRPSSRSNAA